ncbi:MAG: FtsX-like permease family protein [Firmicutes bacterium]|nr:FtsX-like permease family protein [Bacillota bacterium]
MRALNRDFIREIIKTKGRFLSILVLAALAVAFLSGLRAIAPDMKNTLDDYMDSRNMADLQVYASLGLTEDDIGAMLQQDGITDGEAFYLIDAFASCGETGKPVKLWSMPQRIGLLVIREGRMPENSGECLIDGKYSKEENIHIGDTVTLATEGTYEDCLAVESAEVVGIISSPYYISVERGTSTIGNGQATGCIYMLPEAFDMDYYTTALFKLEGADALVAYSDEYEDLVSDAQDALDVFGEERAAIRTAEIKNEGFDKLAEAQDELDEGKQKLADAETEIADARQELDDGWEELADAKRTLAKETADAEKKIADAEKELADALVELNDGEKEYADGIKEYEDGLADYEDGLKKYEDGVKEYEDGEKKLADAAEELRVGRISIREGQAEINAGKAQIAAGRQQILEQQNMLDGQKAAMAGMGMDADTIAALTDGYQAQIDAGSAALDANEAQLAAAEGQLNAGRAELGYGQQEYDRGVEELEKAKAELDDAKAELDDAKAKLEDAEKELADARTELDDGWKEYNDGVAELEDARKELRDKVRDAEKEIADAEKELSDGEEEYADGYEEYLEKKADADRDIADAEVRIADARQDLLDLKDCEWYITGREAAPGYLGFGQDADRMANLAKVFPMLFFIVAALVCLTTMTRMVDEQRMEIGCLKALGYSKLAISKKYILYGALPAVFGSVFGLAFGYTVFPKMIFTAWQIMYDVPDIKLQSYTNISVFSIAAIIVCTALSSLWACFATLTASPAALMRPKTPTAGKRVFLEYIKPLWNRMNFFRKVTARNLFRYKKRLIMTIAGIGGCAALIIAGFGLRTSLTDTMNNQFGRIFRYTASVSVTDSISEEEEAAVRNYLDGSESVTDYMHGILASGTAESPDYSIFTYIQVGEPEDIARFFEIQTYDERKGPDAGEIITLDDSGVIIDQKLSELLNVGVGDSFTLEFDTRRQVTVAAINEHYVAHYVYMTPAYYSAKYHKPYEPDTYLMKIEPDDDETSDRVMTELLALDGVGAANRVADTKNTYMHSMERIDLVVVVVILAAAALAFVVLFNLSNINITERRRELATIKVLGFRDGEVSAYVYRENMILTLFGIILGLALGHWLHVWLVHTTEIDLMMFGRNTDRMAYVWASVLTVLFSVIVNFAAHFSLKKIDMVESLKSAE